MTSEKKPKICIPIPQKNRGGMYTFMRNFRTWLSDHDIPYTNDPGDDFDVLFVNSWVVPFKTVYRLKKSRPDIKVIQRVDGSAWDYGRHDDADGRQARVNLLVDKTIFQSEYSRFSTTEKYKVITQDGPVIYNPVNISRFNPEGKTLDLPGDVRVCNASFSKNPRKGTWKIGTLAEENPDITFVLCGRYPNLPDHDNIELMGHLDREEMAQTMRSCDVFLHLAENDPCPNVVTEALASGLPVLYKDSGGSPELVGDCGSPVTTSTFRPRLDEILENTEELSQKARKRAEEKFSFDVIFPQYLDAIRTTKRTPLPSVTTYLKKLWEGYTIYHFSPKKVAKSSIKSLLPDALIDYVR